MSSKIWDIVSYYWGSACGSVVKNPPANARDSGDTDSTPGSGSSPRVENGNPLQYSCLGNPTDRGARGTTVHGVTKELDATEQLSMQLLLL